MWRNWLEAILIWSNCLILINKKSKIHRKWLNLIRNVQNQSKSQLIFTFSFDLDHFFKSFHQHLGWFLSFNQILIVNWSKSIDFYQKMMLNQNRPLSGMAFCRQILNQTDFIIQSCWNLNLNHDDLIWKAKSPNLKLDILNWIDSSLIIF